eukprot:764089-Hanusia_phi.AAC.4
MSSTRVHPENYGNDHGEEKHNEKYNGEVNEDESEDKMDLSDKGNDKGTGKKQNKDKDTDLLGKIEKDYHANAMLSWLFRDSEKQTNTAIRKHFTQKQFGTPIWKSLQKVETLFSECKQNEKAKNTKGGNELESSEKNVLSKMCSKVVKCRKQCQVGATRQGEPSAGGRKEYQNQILTLIESLLDTHGVKMCSHGPVGEHPLHLICLFALKSAGKSDEISKEICEIFWDMAEVFVENWSGSVHEEYKSDLKHPELLRRKILPYDHGLYTGETALHMAIVGKRKELVEFLLKKGARVDKEIQGAFFKPSVIRMQKPNNLLSFRKRFVKWLRGYNVNKVLRFKFTPNPDSSHVDAASPMVYLGGLPLSLASSIGERDLCKILVHGNAHKRIEAGIDPQHNNKHNQAAQRSQVYQFTNSLKTLWLQDFHGNTALHFAVMHQQKEVFDFLLDEEYRIISRLKLQLNKTKGEGNNSNPQKGQLHHKWYPDEFCNATACKGCNQCIADLDYNSALEIINLDGLTPLLLAIRLGYKDMYEYILKSAARRAPPYGLYLKEFQMDTHSASTAHLKTLCGVEIIAYHEIAEFSDETIFIEIINKKWKQSGMKAYIIRTLIPYIAYLAIFCTCSILRLMDFRADGSVRPADERAKGLQIGKLLATLWLLVPGWRRRRLTYRDFHPNEDGTRVSLSDKVSSGVFKNLPLILYACINATVIASLVCFFQENVRGELTTLALGWVFVICTILQALMPFRKIGTDLLVLYIVLIKHLSFLTLLFVPLLASFGFSIWLTVQHSAGKEEPSEDFNYQGDVFQVMLELVFIMLGQVSFDTFLISSSAWSFTLILQVVWVILFNLLYMNVIIAIVSDEIEKCMKMAHTLWIFPFACEVLRYETTSSSVVNIYLFFKCLWNCIEKRFPRICKCISTVMDFVPKIIFWKRVKRFLSWAWNSLLLWLGIWKPGGEDESLHTDRDFAKSESEKRRIFYRKLFENVDKFECGVVASCKDYTDKLQKFKTDS